MARLHVALCCALLLLRPCQCFQIVRGPNGNVAAARGNVAVARSHVAMAGFGAGSGASKKGGKKVNKKPAEKKAQLSPKRQWDIFKELRSGSAPIKSVFAKLPDEGASWIWVGEVSAKEPNTPEQSATVHKRLILEHAVRCNPSLTARARELICGIAPTAEDEPEILPKQDTASLPPPQSCGYEGKEDSASGYYVTYGAASEAFTGSSKKLGMGGF